MVAEQLTMSTSNRMLHHLPMLAGMVVITLVFGGCGGDSGGAGAGQGSVSASSPGGGTSSTSSSSSSASVTADGTLTILHAFGNPYLSAPDGTAPQGDLLQGSDGALYGLTGQGGGAAIPTIYRITPDGTESVFYLSDTLQYPGSPSSEQPTGSLVLASDGNFYIVIITGHGSIMRVTPGGSRDALYTFDPQGTATGDASWPVSLMQANDGNLYGLSYEGGANGCGTVFKLTLSGTETILHSFDCSSTPSNSGQSRLIQASDGALYGLTIPGTSTGATTVFKITLAGSYSTVYTFGGASGDGSEPFAGLMQASDGNFYGTTASGGANHYGTVFKVTPQGQETIIYSFGQSSVQLNGNAVPAEGYAPEGNLLQASDGNFYGMTTLGGAYGHGTMFKLTPAGQLTVLHTFAGPTADGTSPVSTPLQASNGHIYGTASGGAWNLGIVFVLN
jgi:uncharacterized repeat protein (TIGR03803 family)